MKDKELKDYLTTNREYITDFLYTLEKNLNIHCERRITGNGYFVFTYTDDSICRFNIKEAQEFTFGIWMSENVNLDYYGAEYKNSKLILFAQPTINIDKFKPSRSVFCVPVERYLDESYDFELDEYDKKWVWGTNAAESMIKYIIKHKIRAFYKDAVFTWDIWDDISDIKALIYYIKCYYSDLKRIIVNQYKVNKIVRIVKRKFKNLSHVNACLYSLSSKWSPNIDLIYCVDSDISKEEDDKLTEIDEFLDKNYFMELSCIEYTQEHYEERIKTLKDLSMRRGIKFLWIK